MRSLNLQTTIVSVALTASVICLVAACASDHALVVSDIGNDRVAAALGKPAAALLLDVRSVGEFESGHIPGSVNIPHDELGSRIDEIATHRETGIVVYCERGFRASKAATVLQNEGFKSIQHLAGDMSGWRSAGLPIE